MKSRWIICSLLALSACGVPAPTTTSLPVPAPTTTALAQPSTPPATATPTPDVTSVALADAPPSEPILPEPTPTVALPPAVQAQIDDLTAHVAAGMQIEPTADPLAPDRPLQIEGVRALPLAVAAGQEPLWVVYTIGYARPDPHFIAIYTRRQAQWQELDRLALTADSFIILDGWVRQLALPSDDLWLAVDSGVGAHSAAYDLLRWDDARLSSELHDTTGVAVWGREIDLDGDGVLDLLRDHRNTYIFCHACNLSKVEYRVWRWDGQRMAAVQLTPLSPDASAGLRDLNDTAVRFARGGLWRDAQTLIAEAQRLDPLDRSVRWNKILIDLHAQGYSEQLRSNSYPLLASMFYGDYPAALDLLRPYSVEQLFDQAHPPELGDQERPTAWITETATLALEADPDRAAAYFLRGWAHAFDYNTRALVLPDLERAATLDPNEPLFRDSLALVRQRFPAAP